MDEKNNQNDKQLPLIPYDLDKNRWIKTPIAFSKQGASLSLLQQNVMIMVSKHLQSYIDGFFNDGRNGEHKSPNPAIPDDVLTEDNLVIRLSLSELTSNDRYSKLVAALNDVGDLKMRVKCLEIIKDKNGSPILNEDGMPQVHAVYNLLPIFSKFSIPLLDKRYIYTDFKTQQEKESALIRAGYIDMKINPDVARTVFDMNRGYIEHLADIAKYSSKSSTPRIYFLLKIRMFRKETKPDIPLNELKKFTGHLIVNPETDEIIKEQYPKYSQYAKRVLEPARLDMQRMALLNQIEFVFEYQPKYKLGNLRGNPDSIEFTIMATPLGNARKKARGKSQKEITASLINQNPFEVRKETARRDWITIRDSYQGNLAKVIRRGKFYGTGQKDFGAYIAIFFDDYVDVSYLEQHVDEFRRNVEGLMFRLFGDRYKRIMVYYRSTNQSTNQ